MLLHSYFRSTASWRVRIVLALKGLDAAQTSWHLQRGEQRSDAFLKVNPQGLVPALETDAGAILTQSLAICEYLDELVPSPPLLPATAEQRALVRSLAQMIACDIHPVQNLKVLNRLRALKLDEESVKGWARDVIDEGLDAYETRVQHTGGAYSFGDAPTLADICLIPQLANARRFGVTMRWPRIKAIEETCMGLDAFAQALPDRQPDAE